MWSPPTDLIRSADGLFRWSNAHSFRINNMWSPPMINSLKWNVDGYSLGKSGPSRIGGVLRNHHGHLLGRFSVPVGILDSNIAELRAIVKVIELSTSNCLLHHQHLIIESDSANVISWMYKPHIRPWKHHNLFSFVNRLNAFFGSITFSHIFRESNCLATLPMLLARCISLTSVPGRITIFSLLSIN
jgi:ribonuclease HI